MSAVLPREAAIARDEKEDKTPSAAQRLAESRERMRLWMVRGDGRQEAKRRAAAAEAAGESPAVLDRLRGMPVIGAIIDVVSAWWQHHPMQPAASLAEGVVRSSIGPAVRRHPLLVVSVAFVIGAAVVRFRPWRWLARPALLGGLMSQLVSRGISQMPIESWIGALTAFAHDRNGHDRDAPDERDEIAAGPEPAVAAEMTGPPAPRADRLTPEYSPQASPY